MHAEKEGVLVDGGPEEVLVKHQVVVQYNLVVKPQVKPQDNLAVKSRANCRAQRSKPRSNTGQTVVKQRHAYHSEAFWLEPVTCHRHFDLQWSNPRSNSGQSSVCGTPL
eukprot:3439277-Rhodomonas_salina.2